MKPYVVIVLQKDSNELHHVEEFEQLTTAWDWCARLNREGTRAFAAAVLAAPEVMRRLEGKS